MLNIKNYPSTVDVGQKLVKAYLARGGDLVRGVINERGLNGERKNIAAINMLEMVIREVGRRPMIGIEWLLKMGCNGERMPMSLSIKIERCVIRCIEQVVCRVNWADAKIKQNANDRWEVALEDIGKRVYEEGCVENTPEELKPINGEIEFKLTYEIQRCLLFCFYIAKRLIDKGEVVSALKRQAGKKKLEIKLILKGKWACVIVKKGDSVWLFSPSLQRVCLLVDNRKCGKDIVHVFKRFKALDRDGLVSKLIDLYPVMGKDCPFFDFDKKEVNERLEICEEREYEVTSGFTFDACKWYMEKEMEKAASRRRKFGTEFLKTPFFERRQNKIKKMKSEAKDVISKLIK